jgi:hypothetical protein
MRCGHTLSNALNTIEDVAMKPIRLTVSLLLPLLPGVACAVPPPPTPFATAPRSDVTLHPVPSTEQQVAALQQQVQLLQSQMAALLAVLRVSAPAGAGQRPSLSIEVANFDVRADDSASITAAQFARLRGAVLVLLSSGTATLKSSATLDLQGAVIRMNGGGKPVAVVGSVVQMPATGTGGVQAAGQVVTGDPTVLAN